MPFKHIDKDGNPLWERSLVGTAVHGAEALIELEGGGISLPAPF
jgi:hypothetical protein